MNVIPTSRTSVEARLTANEIEYFVEVNNVTESDPVKVIDTVVIPSILDIVFHTLGYEPISNRIRSVTGMSPDGAYLLRILGLNVTKFLEDHGLDADAILGPDRKETEDLPPAEQEPLYQLVFEMKGV